MISRLLIIFLFLSVLCTAQNKRFVNTRDITVEGMTLFHDKQYDEAIAKFKTISRCDTNYDFAQLEIALTYFQQEKDSDVVEVCFNAYELNSEWDVVFRKIAIESLVRLKDSTAFEQLQLAKKRYPYNEDFLVSEALAHKAWKRYDITEKLLQNLILQNAFNRQAHYYLGELMADKGDYVRAVISLEISLMLASSYDAKSNSALTKLNEIFDNKYEVKIKGAKKDELYKEVEELMEAKLALKKEYKSDVTLNDAVVKQTDVLVKSLEYKSGTTDFWMNFYVPFIVKVKSQKMLIGYTYQFLSTIDHPSVKSGMKKYKNEVDRYIKYAVDYFDEIRQKAPVTVLGKSLVLDKWYYNGNLSGMGKKEGEKRVGNWYFFHEEGTLQSVLTYNNEGKKTDSVTEFYVNGQLKEKYFYTNGILHGRYQEYYANGELKSDLFYVNDSLDGLQKLFHENGAPKEFMEFKKGLRNGKYSEYDEQGNKETDLIYKDGKLEGLQKVYYRGGKLKREMEFKDNLREGKYTAYHLNGNIQEKGNYVKGIQVGKWEEFYRNGQVEKMFVFNNNGAFIDSSLTFFPNGKLQSVAHYSKKGLLNGAELTYSNNGKLLSTTMYKNGSIKTHICYDDKGKILTNDAQTIVNYNEYGNILSKGAHRKGKRVDRWEFYYPNGKISAIEHYNQNGVLEGVYESYYQNGVINTKANYTNGEYDGLYEHYYIDGTLKVDGWFVNGDKVGEWNWYFCNGNPEETAYYIANKVNGFIENWYPDSTANYEREFKNDLFLSSYYYNDQGEERAKIETKNGNGSYCFKGENNEVEYKGTYLYSALNGAATKELNGKIMMSEENYEHGALNGKQIYRYPNGQTYLDAEYFFGEEHGTWKYYNEDGTLSVLRHYNYGFTCDSTLWYYPSGTVETVRYYNSLGEDEGLSLTYYENGRIKKTVPYVADQREGWLVDFDPQGKFMCARLYQNGEFTKAKGLAANGKDTVYVEITGKEDSVITYYDNGNVAVKMRLKNGLFTGEYVKFFYNGKIMEQSFYENDLLEGKNIDFYANGKTMVESNYWMDKLHGENKTYFENGQIREDLNYYLGELHGICKAYNKNGTLLVHAEYKHGYLIKNFLK